MESAFPKPMRAGAQFGFWDLSQQRWTVHPYLNWPAKQPTLVIGNVDGAISGLTISVGYSQAEVQALRGACEQLGDDIRAIQTLLQNCGITA